MPLKEATGLKKFAGMGLFSLALLKGGDLNQAIKFHEQELDIAKES